MNPVIDCLGFARSGASLEFSVPLARLPRFAASVLAMPVETRVRCRGGPDGQGRPGLHLEIDAQYDLACDRCGKALHRDATIRRDFYFVRSEADLGSIAVDPLEEADPLVASERFALVDLVEEELLLDLPISPRHDSCVPADLPHFGASGPEEEPEREHPFAALQKLRRNS